MDNREFSRRLEERTKAFSVMMLKISSALPATPEGKVIQN